MKILNAEQIRLMDAYTIQNEPISSLDLMERAASVCAQWILQHLPKDQVLLVYCGGGNNGGDGFIIGKSLIDNGYKVKIFLILNLNNKKN